AFLRAAGALALTRWLESSLVTAYSYDTFLPRDRFAFPQPARSERHTASGAAELAVHGSLGPVRCELRPSARVEWSRTELHASANFRDQYPTVRTLLVPTLRLGGVVEPVRGVALSASAATGTRLPTIFELFGDGGLVLPALQLRPVKSTTYDGGVTLKGRKQALAGSAELRGFWQERRDSIAMFRTAQYQVKYQNLSQVRQWGAESRVTAEATRWFRTSGSFTWLETETALGKRLPFRPRFIYYARPELRVPIERTWVSSASVSSELWHRSFAFYDNANQSWSDACTKLAFSAALGLLRDRVRVSARMDDSLDARCTDLVGYPLPGRSLFFTLSYREVDHDAS
ncbi:MAG TPA: TonB-dependent receptor, partial [Polyangiaceae bacterium]|nr:TonB-dependent receptor [Polyangiaceae bacterium]